MATDVPISDVLCEAMEYLSKLGANLRTRSENLKDRKIRKDKLQNAHAVQQAVNKVLLICELSKKSLENVEKEVKKIQSRVERSQAPLADGGKDRTKFYYFPYQKEKLKIATKIPIKHYMSVKVHARKMTLAMQNKYPVYYDCKLFRQRKKLEENKIHVDGISNKSGEKPKNISIEGVAQKVVNNKFSKQAEQSDSNDMNTAPSNVEKELGQRPETLLNNEKDVSKQASDDTKDQHSKNEHLKGNCKSAKKDVSDGKEKDNLRENCTSTKKDGDTSEEDDLKENYQSPMKDDSIGKEIDNLKINSNHAKTDKKGKDDLQENRKNMKTDIKVNNDLKENIKNPNKDDDNNKEEDEFLENDKSPKKNNTARQEKRRKSNRLVRIITDSSSENENDTKKSKGSEQSEEIDLTLDENTSVIKSPPSKRRKLILSDDESDNERSSQLPLIPNHKKDNKENCENMSNTEEFTLHSDSENANHVKPSESDSQIPQENSDTKSEEGSSRPLIKCVSISKLLKPEIINKTTDDSQTTKTYTQPVTTPISNYEINKAKTKENMSPSTVSEQFKCWSEKIKKKKTDEHQYWEEKRKEVSNFKPKTFEINISRLPDITKHFLNLHKIKKVISNGSVVCEITTSTPDAEKENDKVKNALLNDSDPEELRIENHNLQDSESQIKNCKTHQSHACPISQKKDSENSLQLYSKSNSHKASSDRHKSAEDAVCIDSEKIKCSLLNDSDSDQSKKDGNNEKHCTNNDINKDKIEDSIKSKQNEKCEEDSPNKIKLALLNSSDDSDDKVTKQKKTKSSLKKKSLMQSMEAKKMLLKYSSSSEDESKPNNLKASSGEDLQMKKHRHKRRRKKSQISSGSSSEGANKTKGSSSDGDLKKSVKENEDNNNGGNNNEDDDDDDKAKHSDSSSSKMVRSKAKPGSSISNNSDSQDVNDKDVDRLTNLKSLNKQSRRHSTAEDSDDVVQSRGSKRGSKPLAMQELMLKAECSSDVPSADESIGAQEEYPPPEPIDLNNGLGHLAKDDLLGESDSSVSQNETEKNTEDAPPVEESEEENVKLKRRKANAISSDSEAGSSRKKEQDTERLSDFEDSEDENSEPSKKSKRKKKGSESDGSAASSEDGGKKKRRRIKQINDSDLSDSDGETEGRNKHGRKNIRKVMGKNQLEEATKKAAREEKERIARIAERQKLYNNLEFDESGKPDEVVLEKVVLDFDPETKEPLIEVDRGLVKKLKPHQANGIKFMWDACFESVKRIKKDKGSGCILAHCMGLGKTLQVISLAHTLLTHGALTGVRRVLVVCPLSTVLNWVNEFRMWLKHAHHNRDVDVYELSRHKQNSERAFQLGQWFECGGVCVLGYEMFRNLSADNNKKFKKKMLKNFQESLVDPGPDLVVCDEGHLLKNEKTSLSQSMNKVKTRRRIVLTGTPLQNNLKEYYCMVQFVKPNLLGKYNEYLNRFVNPITNGQYTDSTEHDIRVMKRRSHVLHKMLDGAVQRRDYGVLAPFLPPKHEYVLFITLSEVQIKLYQYYLDNYSRRPLPGKSSGFLFPDFQSLQRIWTHPLVLKYNSERYEIMQQKKREREEEDSEGSLRDFIDDDSTPEETSTEESSDDLSDMSDDSRKKNKKKKSAKKTKSKDTRVTTRRGTRANPVEHDSDEMETPEVVEAKNENPTEWWIKLVTEDELEDMRNSHKLVLLFDILRQCETIGDKLLVFSQSLYSLDLIEHFLGKVDEATQEGRIDEKLGGHVGSWSPGVDYFRLDGSTSCENRSIWCKNFNREDNPRARLFLISTRAGGLGINLVAANRVVIFDVSWNPSHDVQSIFRVYRFGQKKPCYIYRFLAMGTMEEKIYERQVTKQAISKRVIDEQQIDRHYAENDLAELYKFEPLADLPRQLPALPKDRLFAEMLREHDRQIYKYHEHDSLLENKEEETLTEEERKAAWEDFENEKNKPPPAPFPTAWPMHNGMVPGLLAQQQQQLAYAALAAMLRKDIPNINDNQIRDMLPLIFNSNPGMFGGYDYGMMQKMSEIYKYAQPGMMNPSMMNPVMNAAGSGMGGSSGLQYEPPWQRQHQQQQQLRLQQLMQQQQNHMGAKYYAGGLGSRDPVAMALQQQRAREIMLGGGGGGGGGGGASGRPRGRPPLQPRAPPAAPAHHDIVNLDSD